MTKGKSENIRLTMQVSETRDHIQGAATAHRCMFYPPDTLTLKRCMTFIFRYIEIF